MATNQENESSSLSERTKFKRGIKMGDIQSLRAFRSMCIQKLERTTEIQAIHTYLELIRQVNDILINM